MRTSAGVSITTGCTAGKIGAKVAVSQRHEEQVL